MERNIQDRSFSPFLMSLPTVLKHGCQARHFTTKSAQDGLDVEEKMG